jgi:hypothetical protein
MAPLRLIGYELTVTFKTIGAGPILGVAATFPEFLTILSIMPQTPWSERWNKL